MSHLPLATSLALRYANRGELLDDLIQVARLGLLNAARRYDKKREVAFASYATPMITGELKRHFRDHVWGVHVPRSIKERAMLVSRTIREDVDRTGIEPTSRALSARLGLSEREVDGAREAWSAFQAGSLNAPRSTDRGPSSASLCDVMGNVDSEYERVDGRLTRLTAMREWSGLERRIFCLRYIENLSQSDIASQVGLSDGSVSRLLIRMLAELEIPRNSRARRRRNAAPAGSTSAEQPGDIAVAA